MADDVSKILANYLAQEAGQKNPLGVFGLKVSPFLTDSDKNALRFQQLSQAYATSPQLTAGLNAGQQLGQAATSLFPKQKEERPPDPQMQAIQVYNDVLQKTGSTKLARRQAYQFLAQQGVPDAMDKLYEVEKDAQSQSNEEDKAEFERKKATYKDVGLNERGQIIQENELGGKQAVGSGPQVSVNMGAEKAFDVADAQALAGRLNTIREADLDATRQIPQYDRAISLAKRIPAQMQGPVGRVVGPLAKTVGSLIGQDLKTGDISELNSLALEMKAGIAKKFAPVSNVDMVAITEGLPGSTNPRDASIKMAIAKRAEAEFTHDMRVTADQFIKDARKEGRNPAMPDPKGRLIDDYIQEKLGKKNYLSENDRKFFEITKKNESIDDIMKRVLSVPSP